MTDFGFLGPAQTVFGRGSRHRAFSYAAEHATRVIIVRGNSASWGADLKSELEAVSGDALEVLTQGEPTIAHLQAALEKCRPFQPECVVAVGGGSAIDLGKALAALVPSEGDPLDHLEIVGRGLPIIHDPLPLVAVPTTSGTGAEATKNAVIAIPERGLKVSLRESRMIPRLAVVDPALTDGAPKALTLATGLDALTQLMESYLSVRANPITDALCRDGIPSGIFALNRLMSEDDPTARDSMALVSYLSGLALANSGLGVVHGLAAVIGGRCGAAHGAICGRLLSSALEVNERAVRRAGQNTGRFAQVDAWLADGFGSGMGSGYQSLRRFVDDQGLPTLAALGCNRDDYEAIAEDALNASSTKANPVPLNLWEVVEIIDQA
ncbi:MAG: iron-containing alcohol dehydrogenase [Rhodobacteraceae bacterium]|nr:iron-containing alcohol dehydrogenase [Paracoccaceae bacterium]